MNRCTTSGVHDVIPHKNYYGRKQNLSHLQIFGTIAYVHIPDEKRRKLDPISMKWHPRGVLTWARGVQMLLTLVLEKFVSTGMSISTIQHRSMHQRQPDTDRPWCWETCPSGWNRMEDAKNRLITEPAPIGTDRLEGQRCKYAEKSYMYKYDLGHTFCRELSILFCKVV